MSDSERAVTLPAHLWEALDTMAKEMGLSSDALVGQAVFTLARLNGYVVPGKVLLGAGAGAAASVGATAAPKPPSVKPAPTSTKGAPLPPPGKRGRPEPEPEPEPAPEDYPPEEQSNPFEDQQQQDEEPPPEEEPMEEPPPEEEPEPEPPPPPPKKGGGATALTLTMTGRDPFKLQGDSMIIGRGKHCDFVIESNRVSREHCRITKEGADWVLEDLNSSNGTFFGPGKEKVSRRKIKDGDEFTFGTEKVKFSLRAR
jgi:hypothetical protein